MISTTQLSDAIRAALSAVDDPELPGVSIIELGLLESLEVGLDGKVRIGLIPTFSGCPALTAIANDVRMVVERIEAVSTVEVVFLTAPAWSIDRVTGAAEAQLRNGLGIAVERSGRATCPRCATVTSEQSMFGPTRCRAVHRCQGCGEVVEVMR